MDSGSVPPPKRSIWTREIGFRRPWISLAIAAIGLAVLVHVLWEGLTQGSLSSENLAEGGCGLILLGKAALSLLMRRTGS